MSTSMSDNNTKMKNGSEVNEVPSNLPPPGGGMLVSSADDRVNGNGLGNQTDGADTMAGGHTLTNDRLTCNRHDLTTSVPVGGARPKAKTFGQPRNGQSPVAVELAHQSRALNNGYHFISDDSSFDEPPSYEAAMAMISHRGSDREIQTQECRGMHDTNIYKYSDPTLHNCVGAGDNLSMTHNGIAASDELEAVSDETVMKT